MGISNISSLGYSPGSLYSKSYVSEGQTTPFVDYSLFNNSILSILGINLFGDNESDSDFSSVLMLYNMYTHMNYPPPSIPWQDYNIKTDLKALTDVYDSQAGNRLANCAARKVDGTIGDCLKKTREAMTDAGFYKGGVGSLGGSAYQAASGFAQGKNFTKSFAKVDVSRDDLTKLPAGCVIIFNKKENYTNVGYSQTPLGDVHGHIFTTDGAGNALSGNKESIASVASRYHDKSYTVWIPAKTQKVDKVV